MARRSSDEFAFEIAGALAERASASDVLSLLRGLGNAPAAILTLPATAAARPAEVAAVHGYDRAIIREITAARFTAEDPAYREIRADADRPWRCWWDLAFNYGTTTLGHDLLVPAGFRGGVSLRLTTRYGRYVGDLHMSTEDVRHPSPSAMRVLYGARHALAQLCAAAEPGPVGESPRAVVQVWRDGEVDVLSPGPDPSLVPALRDMVRCNVDLAFSAGPGLVRRWRAPDGTWHRAVFHSAARAAIVEVRPEPMPFGLTPRELEVLALVAEGLANVRISRRLRLSERTVAHCVERLLDKLGVESRAGAAGTAERRGLLLVG